MSFKANVIANYAGQVYVTVINLIMAPIYLRYLGAEAYGLVGFFIMLQMWFQLLDIGLTPTMSRETARFCAGATEALDLRRLLRTLEGIFAVIGLVGATVMVLGADLIALNWLNVQSLPLAEVRHAIMIMALLIALRWIGGLYKGVFSGMEKQVWLNGFNIISSTVRCLLAIPVFLFLGNSPTYFFLFQLVVAVAETFWLIRSTYQLLPVAQPMAKMRISWAPLRPVLGFTLSVAFTSAAWVLVTQTDKLILSKMLPLADYACFTLAVMAAGGVMLINAPLTTALQPRLTRVVAAGDNAGAIRLYRMATQLVAIICVPASLILGFFPEQVLWAWTGNHEVASKAGHVLTLYALGNGVLGFSALPYLLQFANGDMRLHVVGNVLLTGLLIPGLIWGTIQYGMNGAGYVWLGSNLIFFLLWVPFVHRRFFTGFHLKWLTTDVCTILLLPLTGAVVLQRMVTWPQDRGLTALVIFCIGLIFLMLSAASSSWFRAESIRRVLTQRKLSFTD